MSSQDQTTTPTRLEAFVLHKSDHELDGNWYSLGIYEQREGDHSILMEYKDAAECYRLRAQRAYGRPVKLVENKYEEETGEEDSP